MKRYEKPVEKKKRNKFGAVATEVDGIKFPSKLEANYYAQLKLRVRAGEVLYFLRQVPFYIPGGVRYVVDFMEVHADGSVHYIDTKGKETETFKIKKKLVEHHYPVMIELVNKVR